jgi:hypothetical protein
MRVRMIGFGSNWWAARSDDRQPAWFNSAGLSHGRRVDHCWIWTGQVRFNCSSGFHPEFRERAIGRTFRCELPTVQGGRTHLLVTSKSSDLTPDEFLVMVTDGIQGQIFFHSRDWSSLGVQPISISCRGPRFEALLLMRADSWFRSELGTWKISDDGRQLALTSV